MSPFLPLAGVEVRSVNNTVVREQQIERLNKVSLHSSHKTYSVNVHRSVSC